MSIAIREACLTDGVSIHAIETECFSDAWSMEAIQRELSQHELKLYYVLEAADGAVVGYAGLWHVLDEGEIINIAVLPGYRGNGHGEMLLRVVMERAWQLGCSHIFLEVRFSNLAAIGLYQKLGYEMISVRKEYYSDPIEDAYVMECKREAYQWDISYIKDE